MPPKRKAPTGESSSSEPVDASAAAPAQASEATDSEAVALYKRVLSLAGLDSATARPAARLRSKVKNQSGGSIDGLERKLGFELPDNIKSLLLFEDGSRDALNSFFHRESCYPSVDDIWDILDSSDESIDLFKQMRWLPLWPVDSAAWRVLDTQTNAILWVGINELSLHNTIAIIAKYGSIERRLQNCIDQLEKTKIPAEEAKLAIEENEGVNEERGFKYRLGSSEEDHTPAVWTLDYRKQKIREVADIVQEMGIYEVSINLDQIDS